MLSIYPACFFEEGDGGYSVVFPDLNGLATQGDTKTEAFEMAVDCLAGYLYACQRDGEDVPAASDLNAIDLQRVGAELGDDAPRGFVSMVSVDVADYAKKHFEKSVKKTLSIPAWLNAAAQEQGINFSQVLQDALKKQLHIG